jgi:type II secretory pathway component GspD/PulD (secretin)
MRSYVLVLLVALFACTALGSAVQSVTGTETNVEEEELRLTRVFYLQGIDTSEVITLLRSQLQVKQITEFQGREVVIVTETTEKVERCENLLRELDALAKVVEPHAALDFARKPEAENSTRIFTLSENATKTAVVVLRSMYQLRKVTELADKSMVVVTAPPAKLDASEALLKELGVLSGVSEPAAP